jgi:hypothetical protein
MRMSSNRKRQFSGVAAPVSPGLPALVRLCSAFVDSLPTILKIAFIAAALSFAKDFRELATSLRNPVVESESESAEPARAEIHKGETRPEQSVVNDRVKHYLNCTHAEYRNQHYDECVDEPSTIYARPAASPDDTSFVPVDLPFRFAGLPSERRDAPSRDEA